MSVRTVKPWRGRPGWTIEDQSRNGVKVKVMRNKDGSYVEADCDCLGMLGRVHSSELCPVYRKVMKFSSK